MENETIVVEGMKCASCRRAIEATLEQLAGVTAVEADVDAGTVDITYDGELTNHEAICNCIEAQGYVVVA